MPSGTRRPAFFLASTGANRDDASRLHADCTNSMHVPASLCPRRRTTLWWLAWVAAGFLVTATVATLRAQGDAADDQTGIETAKIVKKATPRFIEVLLDKLELEYKPTGKNGYLIKLENVKMLVFIENAGGIMLYCGFQGIKANTAKVNEWNKKHRFTRAYIDDSNDPVLESDLDFDGGVTLESLKIFVTGFKSAAAEYKKFLSP